MTDFARRNFRWLDFALVVLASVLAIGAYLAMRAPSVLSAEWLFRDGSLPLNAAAAILKGQSLYRDIQWNYGPLPIYFYAVFASVLGNSPAVLLLSTAVVYALSLGFLYVAAVKYLTRRQAFMTLAFGSLPVLLAASVQGENTAPFEFLSLSIIAALYAPLKRRSSTTALLMGAAAGASQWSKFGSGVVAAATILILDLIGQFRENERAPWPIFLKSLLAGAMGFVALELSREVFHFYTLPFPYALDATFPLYYKDWYAAYVTPAIRFPKFITFGYLVGVQLPILAGLCSGIAIILSDHLRRYRIVLSNTCFPYAMCIAPIYYCLGCIGYFRHVFHFLQYGFILGGTAGYVLVSSKGSVRALLLLLLLPVSVNLARAVVRDIHPASRGLALVALPNGSHLFLSNKDRSFVEAVTSVLGKYGIGPHGRAVLCYPEGAGLEFFLGFPRVGRQSEVISVLIRPSEQPEFFKQLMASAGILLINASSLPDYMRIDPKGVALSIFPDFDRAQRQVLGSSLGQPAFIVDRAVFMPIMATRSSSSIQGLH